jgi:flagellar assembly protein FliH
LAEADNVFVADDFRPGTGKVFRELPGLEEAGEFRILEPGDSTVVLKRSEFEQKLREEHERGFRKAIREKEQFRNETVNNLASMIARADRSIRDAIEGAGGEVLNLSIEIAKKIIGKEIEFNCREVLQEKIHSCLDYMEDRLPLLIRVHPADRDAAVSILDESGYSVPGRIKLVDDDNLGRGSCIVKLDRGSLRAVISEQLEIVERTLTDEYEEYRQR